MFSRCSDETQSCTLKNMMLAPVQTGKEIVYLWKHRKMRSGFLNFFAGLINFWLGGLVILALLNVGVFSLVILLLILCVPGAIGILIGIYQAYQQIF